jgi:hypothetical protein
LAKYTLDIEPDYDFLLIGISSHEKDYRLSWALKKELDIDFKKVNSLEIKDKKQPMPAYFSLYECADEANYREYFIVSNFSEQKNKTVHENNLFDNVNEGYLTTENEWLIPEQKTMNYFFILKGEVNIDEQQDLVKKIKSISFVLTANIIDAESLKSKQHLIF